VPLGKTLGFSGRGSLNGSTLAYPALRVLALVSDAFGGRGGIAQYNRHLFTALAACDRIGELIVVPRGFVTSPHELPPRVRQLPAVQGRFAYSLAVLRAARAERPIDIVFCGHLFMAPLAAGVAKLLRAPLWVQVHGIEAWQELSGIHRRSAETAALITSVSRFTRRRLLEWIGIDPTRVKVLPNTVDPQFRPGPKPGYLMDRYDARGKRVLMTVSRLSSSERYKGHDRVIRILPRVLADCPETIYLVVGDGDDRPRLEALAAEFGVRDKLRFAGLVSSDELPDCFRLADVFVMPSTGEGFGIVFLEAMASGIDVISGNQDGSIDPLADGLLGSVVDPENGDELALAICSALLNSAANVDRTSRFKVQAFAEHLQAVLWASFSAST
jgi:phosphatidylinositol alpha-1,6-mannosyltransferase